MATGISTMSEDIASKKIDLMRNAVTGLARLAILDGGSSGSIRQAEAMRASAISVGIESKMFLLADPTGFVAMLDQMREANW
jgi:hypothetical protein